MHLRKFLAHPALPARTRQQLLDKTPSDPGWHSGDPLSSVRHCHFTNTPEEMADGLTHDYNFIEGDVRLEWGARRLPLLDRWREPIMAHDLGHVDGLTLNEWLDIGKASGLGLKLDVKQAAALPKILHEVKQHQIPDDFLIFNGDVTPGPGGPRPLSLKAANLAMDLTLDREDLQSIRRQFPQALISLGAYTGAQPPDTSYTPEQLHQLSDLADQVGGPISFPLRAEFVTPEVVETLKPHGAVSIWNDPISWSPHDLEAETRRFRAMGVDGMIDLR